MAKLYLNSIATPTQIEAFKARTNKKDSFHRWFQKHGAI